MDAYDGMDLQVGEIRAVRTFRIGPGGTLYPLFSDSPWSEGANTARCRLAPPLGVDVSGWEPHTAPEPDCTCGYYAYGSEEAALEYAFARHVLAVISCWGHVVAGTRGIRAQHARVEAIWMSEIVPADLAAMVRSQYPSVEVFADRASMLAAYPPSTLECYVAEPPRDRLAKRVALRIAIGTALVVGLLPPHWLGSNSNARLVWAAELAFFVLAALVLRRRRTDFHARRRALLFFALALWLVAPFAGVAGTLLLRLPLMQLAALTAVQRRLIAQEATRFPATVGRRFG